MAEKARRTRQNDTPDEAQPQSGHLSAVASSSADIAATVQPAPTRFAADITPIAGLIDVTRATPQEVIAAYLDLARRGGLLLAAMRQKEYGTIQNERIGQLEWTIQHCIDTLSHTDASGALPDAMYCLGVLQSVLAVPGQ